MKKTKTTSSKQTKNKRSGFSSEEMAASAFPNEHAEETTSGESGQGSCPPGAPCAGGGSGSGNSGGGGAKSGLKIRTQKSLGQTGETQEGAPAVGRLTAFFFECEGIPIESLEFDNLFQQFARRAFQEDDTVTAPKSEKTA